jgi:hypothetical protein
LHHEVKNVRIKFQGLLYPSYTLNILIKKRRQMPLFVTTIHKALHQGLQESYDSSHNIFAHVCKAINYSKQRRLSLIGDFEIFLRAVLKLTKLQKKNLTSLVML